MNLLARFCLCWVMVALAGTALGQSLVGTWKGGFVVGTAKGAKKDFTNLLKAVYEGKQVTLTLKKDKSYTMVTTERGERDIKESGIWTQFGQFVTLAPEKGPAAKMRLSKDRKKMSKDGDALVTLAVYKK